MCKKIALLALLTLIYSSMAQADTIIPGGSISGTWTVQGSPYYINGHTYIAQGATLTIQPGVLVIFNPGHFEINIYGVLNALGTVQDSIIFTATDTVEGWQGLKFYEASSTGHLAYCQIEYGRALDPEPDNRGGGVYLENSGATVEHCTFQYNKAQYGGGMALFNGSGGTFSYNTFRNNWAWSGGGIYHDGFITNMDHCVLENNVATQSGGGMRIVTGSIYLNNAVFRNNSAGTEAGGLLVEGGHPRLHHLTIINNTAATETGGLKCANLTSPFVITSNLIWGNSLQQVTLSGMPASSVSYCDVQGGFPGGLNIMDQDPQFLDTAWIDYRLAWGSPCIDTGNPEAAYNDPDLTRSDIGGLYFDQSHAVSARLTPHADVAVVPPGGGGVEFTLRLTNIMYYIPQVEFWCNATLPSGNLYGPVLGPVTLGVAPGATLTRLRTQTVPGNAPAGVYLYNAMAKVVQDTSKDSFAFIKAGSGTQVAGLGSWSGAGEDLANGSIAELTPSTFALYPGSPNPFNPTTAISYQLSAVSRVSLQVYDTAGKLVCTLVEGMQEAGEHRVTFDGSGLSSGLYFARLQAGGYTAIQKLALLK